MSKISLTKPCAAYNGSEPFVFISYAHADRDRVYSEIKALNDQGYRIWYDEGISPGNEWSEEIARTITGCALFIVFISQNATLSNNVKNEIYFALDQNKPFLAVHLEETALPPGLQLRMGGIQAILKWRMSKGDYMQKIVKSFPGNCLEKSKQVLTQEIAISIEQGNKNTISRWRLFGGIAIILIVFLIIAIIWSYFQIPDGFVFIKGGTYLMGSLQDEFETQHSVKVGDFYMAKYPVTVAQFEIFISETNYQTDADKGVVSFLDENWSCDTSGELQKNKQHPVIYVSWNDATAYIRWLSKKLHKTFRLPTEAEWEYACRAGTTTPFYTGSNLTTDQANYNGNLPYQNYPKGRWIGRTTPVGIYPPNGWGLYDMSGNVYEWCLDWYGEKYYDECKRQGIVDNPQGPGTGSFRVLRGGSWLGNAWACRSAFRYFGGPDTGLSATGFRLVFLR